ncbi:hypothetical protein [Halalkalicoccus subterraneus]|uniref:hypothetical protein n=1 Tax=Halalkalicoccus subterraneus TaxID=2675002 RepID=UPI000EFC2F94|nr:hypothetical protein [Halalkalicoccus subterraneus]
MISNISGVDSRTLAVSGAFVLIATVVILSIGIDGSQSIGYAGPPIAASGVLIAVFALLGFD